MIIDNASSERLNLLRFPLIVGVVFIHAYWSEVGLSYGAIGVAHTESIAEFVMNIISQGVARIAVPLFFLMSGYFFFLDFSWSAHTYKIKLLHRVKTLLVPFLIWNIFNLILYAVAQNLPSSQGLFSGKNAAIATYDMFDYTNAIFGITRSPISYQFWFIRDLMVLVMLAPLIYLIIQVVPKIFLVVVYGLWFSNIWPVYVPSVGALAFFYAGSYFASSGISLFSLDRYGFVVTLLYLFILVVDTLSKGALYNSYVHLIGIIFGIVSVLYLTRILRRLDGTKKTLLFLSGCSFFVFAAHEPLLVFIKRLIFNRLGLNSDSMIIITYITIPIFVITTCVLLYYGMKHIAPRFLSIISGGR